MDSTSDKSQNGKNLLLTQALISDNDLISVVGGVTSAAAGGGASCSVLLPRSPDPSGGHLFVSLLILFGLLR